MSIYLKNKKTGFILTLAAGRRIMASDDLPKGWVDIDGENRSWYHLNDFDQVSNP